MPYAYTMLTPLCLGKVYPSPMGLPGSKLQKESSAPWLFAPRGYTLPAWIVLLVLLWQGSPRKVALWRNHKRACHTSLAWQWVFPGPTSQKTLKRYRKSLWSFSRETGNICFKVFFFSAYSLKLLENIIVWLQGDFLSSLEVARKPPGIKNHYHLHRRKEWIGLGFENFTVKCTPLLLIASESQIHYRN